MSSTVSREAAQVLTRALQCLEDGVPSPLTGPETAAFSERCVEVPWVASQLGDPGRLLDVGWAMSPPEWLGVLLEVRRRGSDLVGIDIIDPQRVRTRYPADILDEVLSVPIRVESVLDAVVTDGAFDTMTCVSTLEHIGIDVASPPDDTSTAFVRAASPEEATTVRDPGTDRMFLDAAHRLLRPGGRLLISVPAGHGVPILHQDSLGLFTHQFEYDEASWSALASDGRFEVVAEAYFRHDDVAGWQAVAEFESLTDQTSALRPFATGCAMVTLQRR